MHINWKPDEQTVRQFAWLAPPGFALWAGLAALAGVPGVAVVGCATVGVIILLGSRIDLRVAELAYVGLSILAFPVGWLMSRVLLAVLYYGVLTPIGVLLRLGGRDPLERRFDREAWSYWRPRPPAGDATSYFRQF